MTAPSNGRPAHAQPVPLKVLATRAPAQATALASEPAAACGYITISVLYKFTRPAPKSNDSLDRTLASVCLEGIHELMLAVLRCMSEQLSPANCFCAAIHTSSAPHEHGSPH